MIYLEAAKPFTSVYSTVFLPRPRSSRRRLPRLHGTSAGEALSYPLPATHTARINPQPTVTARTNPQHTAWRNPQHTATARGSPLVATPTVRTSLRPTLTLLPASGRYFPRQ
eukprot:Rmarinus@m.18415